MSLVQLQDDVAVARDLTGRQLRQMLWTGAPVEPASLAGFEYRGVSLLPGFARAVSWTKFAKAFISDAAGVRGWNVRVVDSPIDDDVWQPQRDRGGSPKTFGHFLVRRSRPGAGALLDYGACARWYEPLGFMRDPLVCFTPGDATRLLGGTYLQLGPARVWTPAFFYLHRSSPCAHVPALPEMRPR